MPTSIQKKIRDVERMMRKRGLEKDPVALEKLSALKDKKRVNECNLKEKKLSTKYHLVRFVERKKLTRKIRSLEKKLITLNPDSKEWSLLDKTRQQLEADLTYVMYFPKTCKYIALFAGDSNEVDSSTEALRTKARTIATAARAEDLEKGSVDRVKHAMDVEYIGRSQSRNKNGPGGSSLSVNMTEEDIEYAAAVGKERGKGSHERMTGMGVTTGNAIRNDDSSDSENDKDDIDDKNDDDDDDDDNDDGVEGVGEDDSVASREAKLLDGKGKLRQSAPSAIEIKTKKSAIAADAFFLEEEEAVEGQEGVSMETGFGSSRGRLVPRQSLQRPMKGSHIRLRSARSISSASINGEPEKELSKQELRLRRWQTSNRQRTKGSSDSSDFSVHGAHAAENYRHGQGRTLGQWLRKGKDASGRGYGHGRRPGSSPFTPTANSPAGGKHSHNRIDKPDDAKRRKTGPSQSAWEISEGASANCASSKVRANNIGTIIKSAGKRTTFDE